MSKNSKMYGLHQGYLYQDLLAAFLISENLHKVDFKIGVEYKEHSSDSFDDIVIVADGIKTKLQIKHSAKTQALTEARFTQPKGDLNLTKLTKSFLSEGKVNYVVATNMTIGDSLFFSQASSRKAFFLRSSVYSVNPKKPFTGRSFIGRLTIESGLPEASFDLGKPGNLEKELLESLRLTVGIGHYPNNIIPAVDVAGRLIQLVSRLRASRTPMLADRRFILQDLGLNFEYGHISQEFPFVSEEYRLYRKESTRQIKNLISSNKFVVLEGLPGSGKSHIFDDLFYQTLKSGVRAARHFCYLEPTDKRSQERIVADAVYGNFFHQLAKLEPELAKEIRPYFAGTRMNVEKLIEKIVESGKRVVLMIDGLDHLSRVVAQSNLSSSMVSDFVDNLLRMRIPDGCSVFIASQPGGELAKIIKEKKAVAYSLQPWGDDLVREFVNKHNEHLPGARKIDASPSAIKLLTQKTEGNPLYLTYAVNEIISTNGPIDAIGYFKRLPQLNSDLDNYYTHLIRDVARKDFDIIQTLALLDFSVTGNELTEMFPPIQKTRIKIALNGIRPILKPGVLHGGISIYHESFRRFVINRASGHGQQGGDLYGHITTWLEKKGFFISQRAYRYLVPYLIRSSSNTKIFELFSVDFVAKSLFYFHSEESIVANLNKVADYSARRQRWDVYCRVVELRRALHTYSEERDYADPVYHRAVLNAQGVDMFCERLIFDGKPVFSKTYGVLLCQMAEHAGGSPPWDFYDVEGLPMQTGDDSQVRRSQEIQAAHFLNYIRKTSVENALMAMKKLINRNSFPGAERRQIKLLLREFNYVFSVSDNYQSLINLRLSRENRLILSVNVAQYLYKDGHKKNASKLSNAVVLKTKNATQILQCISSGANPPDITATSDICELTNQILKFEKLYDNERSIFEEWYNALRLFSYRRSPLVNSAKSLIVNIDGWYKAWILYLFDLASLESSSLSRVRKQVILENALSRLILHAHPFRGRLRAMDLYAIRDFSRDSFQRTLAIAYNFSNFSKIISLLSIISQKTTSYLQGSSAGPLTGGDLNGLLADASLSLDYGKKLVVKNTIEKTIKKKLGISVYYSSDAVEYLNLAVVLGRSRRSRECLMNGCIRLVAYGERKDVTIFEIIEPLKCLKPPFSIEALKKVYPLVETVWRCTDGSETKWGLVTWLKALVDSDTKIAIQAITEMIAKGKKRDWRVESGTEYLCEKLLEDGIGPEIVAALYETIDQARNVNLDVSIGLKITKALLEGGKRKRAKELFSFISRTLYLLSIIEYVYEKENFSKVLLFSRKYKLAMQEDEASHFATKGVGAQSSDISASKYVPPSPPRYRFHKLSLVQIYRLIEENSAAHFLHNSNVKNLGMALLKFSATSREEVYDLILLLVRKGISTDDDIDGLIQLRDMFQTNKISELAAAVSMLGFVYVRGGRGWYSLADEKYNFLATDAFSLSRVVAQKTFATEMSYLFSTATYFIGPVRHLVRFFGGKNVGLAQKIWNEAFEVINFRLPTDLALRKLLEDEAPSFNYRRSGSVNVLINDLIRVRKNIT